VSSTVLPRSGTNPPPRAARRRRLAIGVALGIGLLGLVYTADVAMARDSVPRGVHIAGVDVGGRSVHEAERTLGRALSAQAAAPVSVMVDGTPLQLDPAKSGLSLDASASIDGARNGGLAPWARVSSLFSSTDSPAVAKVDEDALRTAIEALAKKVDRSTREGAVRFDGLVPVAVQPQTGRTLDVEGAAKAVAEAYLGEASAPVQLPVEVTPVKSVAADVDRALTELARPAVAAPVTLTGQGRTLVLQPRDIAASLRIEADANGAINPLVDAKALESSLGRRLTAVETPAKDARFSLAGTKISIAPSANGVAVDVEAISSSLVATLRQAAPRTGTLPLVSSEPRLSTARAKTLGIKEPIGSGTTFHPCCRPRVQNIHRMADIVHGAVVLPGETFSLNGFVGPRDRRRGFVDAPMILDGEFVDAVGGGVSQFATTMFNAVFFSGLEDVEHKPHSYYISRYPPGREATVSHPQPDLKWRNDSPHGVLVQTSYTSKSITVTFWGTKVYDSVEASASPRTRYRGVTTEYRSGRGCESRGGAPGFDITVTRVFRKGGAVVKTEKFFTRYRMETRIVCRRG
jgi:vancomycin resistance protein YoaR